MKEIICTNGYIIKVDDEDYGHLSKFNWCARKNGKLNLYAVRYQDRKNIYMHQTLLIVPKGFHVDHKDQDSLNNQKNNLRKATVSQNCANRKAAKNKSSQYLGVHKMPDGKFQAYSRKNYTRHFGWSFATEEEAALAYNKLAVRLHGEFASINIIQK